MWYRMKEINIKSIDNFSIKSMIERKCFNYVHSNLILDNIEDINKEMKISEYGYQFNGSKIRLYTKSKLIYLSIEIKSLDNDMMKLIFSKSIGKISILYLSIALLPLIYEIIGMHPPIILILILPITYILIILFEYLFEPRKMKQFVCNIFQDLIIKSS